MDFTVGIVLGIIISLIGTTIANKGLCKKIFEFVDLFKIYTDQMKIQNELKKDEIAIISAKAFAEYVRTDRQDAIEKIFHKYNPK